MQRRIPALRRGWVRAAAFTAVIATAAGTARAREMKIGRMRGARVEGNNLSFAVRVLNPAGTQFQATIQPEVWRAGCTVPSCRVLQIAAIPVPPTSATSWAGWVGFRAPEGRRAYLLRLRLVEPGSADVYTFQTFYVEKPNEQDDSFRSWVSVRQTLPDDQQCHNPNYAWTFDRSSSNHLRIRQNFDLCTGKPITSWIEHPQARMESSPTVAMVPTGVSTATSSRIDLFYRGDGRLWTIVWLGKPFVNDPFDLGGPITSAPSAIAPTWNTREVFYRGASNELVARRLVIGNSWGPAVTLLPAVDSAPAAFSFGNGVDVVVFRGTNKNLWAIVRDRRNDPDAAWGPAADLGVELISPPGIALQSDGSLLVVEYRGLDNKVWEIQWDGKAPSWEAPRATGLYP